MAAVCDISRELMRDSTTVCHICNHPYISIIRVGTIEIRIASDMDLPSRGIPIVLTRMIVLGLLRIPRSTPVPWIKDNAILALPDNVLTYVVLYTFS
jgi:hypothetical protein